MNKHVSLLFQVQQFFFFQSKGFFFVVCLFCFPFEGKINIMLHTKKIPGTIHIQEPSLWIKPCGR